jgi:heterodisulfide reductase subunit C
LSEKEKSNIKGRFIIERQYIDDDRISEPEKLESGGVDMSGRWGVLVQLRTITDFNYSLLELVMKHPRGDRILNCWQCGNCTAACPVAEKNPLFNPRYFIYVVRMGYEQEFKRVKEAVYLCMSCGRCSEVCPRGVDPSGVMEAIGTMIRRAW